MSRNNLTEDWDTEEHPSLEMLRQYQAGELSAPQSHQLERHLLTCELCSDLIEGMALSKPTRVKLAVRETRGRLKNLLAEKKRKRNVFHWPIWQTAAVLLVLLFAIAEVVYHHYFAKNGHFQSSSTEVQTSWHFTGQVVDTTESAISGAVIKVKGTDTQAITDQKGKFSIDLHTNPAVLVISHQDYREQEVEVTTVNNHGGFILTK